MAPQPLRRPLVPEDLHRDLRPSDIFIRAVAALLSAHQDFIPDPIPRHWHEDPAVEMLTRAATSPAMITGLGWADSLAQTALADFVLSIGPQSAGAAVLRRAISLQFSNNAAIKVPSITSAAANAGFVGEGNPIPVRQLSFDAGVTLAPRRFVALAEFTREIFQHSTPSVETLVRAVLSESVGAALDSAMFSFTAGDATRPAGLLLNLSATTPSAAGDWAMLNDVEILAGAVAPVSSNAPLLFVASPKQAARLRFSNQIKDIEIFGSSALADKTIICNAGNCLCSAIDPVPKFDVTDQATVVMRDDPTALGTVGSPNVVGAPARSQFQSDVIGLRMRFEMSWGLRSATGLAFMNAVNW
jgi:hypothetical protein